MTMRFRTATASLRTIISDAAAGRYQVIGYQRQEKSAGEFKDTNRLVEVYWKGSNFDKRKGRLNGPVNNGLTIAVEFTVSAASKVDLSVIDNVGSSDAERAAAMLAAQEASFLADTSFDELTEIVYQIIMDARNIDLGLSRGEVANRWISAATKNDPNPRGQLVTLTGFLEFTCDVSEDVPGDTGLPIDTMDISNDINNDTVQKTGIEIKY